MPEIVVQWCSGVKKPKAQFALEAIGSKEVTLGVRTRGGSVSRGIRRATTYDK
jgi:hypothetical protein